MHLLRYLSSAEYECRFGAVCMIRSEGAIVEFTVQCRVRMQLRSNLLCTKRRCSCWILCPAQSTNAAADQFVLYGMKMLMLKYLPSALYESRGGIFCRGLGENALAEQSVKCRV